jgi:hypothetical protein
MLWLYREGLRGSLRTTSMILTEPMKIGDVRKVFSNEMLSLHSGSICRY